MGMLGKNQAQVLLKKNHSPKLAGVRVLPQQQVMPMLVRIKANRNDKVAPDAVLPCGNPVL